MPVNLKSQLSPAAHGQAPAKGRLVTSIGVVAPKEWVIAKTIALVVMRAQSENLRCMPTGPPTAMPPPNASSSSAAVTLTRPGQRFARVNTLHIDQPC